MIQEFIEWRASRILTRKYGPRWWEQHHRAGSMERRLRARIRRPYTRVEFIVIPVVCSATVSIALQFGAPLLIHK